MQIGIVGAPNQGKSTFFNAATLAGAPVADFPFTTINANQGVGHVKVDCPDKEFGVKCNPRKGYCIDNKRFVPITLLDVAGLVPDAHTGKGLGNQFLGDLASASCLIHVIDVSGKTSVLGERADQSYENVRSKILFLEKEIDYWMKGILEKNWQRFTRQVSAEKGKLSESIANQFSGLGVNEAQILNAIEKSSLNQENASKWSDEDLFRFSTKLREISKPMVIAANKIDVEGAKDNYIKLREEFKGYKITATSAESELALRNASKAGIIKYIPGNSSFEILDKGKLSEKQSAALGFIEKFLGEYKTTGVQEVLNYAVFELLRYIVVFPGGVNKLTDSKGNVLPDAFLLPPNSTALNFAYTIHSDFGNNFVCAIDVRSKMKLGKEHKLKNRDVIELVLGK